MLRRNGQNYSRRRCVNLWRRLGCCCTWFSGSLICCVRKKKLSRSCKNSLTSWSGKCMLETSLGCWDAVVFSELAVFRSIRCLHGRLCTRTKLVWLTVRVHRLHHFLRPVVRSLGACGPQLSCFIEGLWPLAFFYDHSLFYIRCPEQIRSWRLRCPTLIKKWLHEKDQRIVSQMSFQIIEIMDQQNCYIFHFWACRGKTEEPIKSIRKVQKTMENCRTYHKTKDKPKSVRPLGRSSIRNKTNFLKYVQTSDNSFDALDKHIN